MPTPRGEGKKVPGLPAVPWLPEVPWKEGKEVKAEETVDREKEWDEESDDSELEEGDEDDVEEYEGWNDFPGPGVKLGNCGIILVLFETPSGFALFSYDGVKLLLPGAIEDIWTDFVKCEIAEKFFSEDELKKMLQDAPKYKDKLYRNPIKIVYGGIVRALGIRNKWLRQMPRYLKEAEEAYEATQLLSQVVI